MRGTFISALVTLTAAVTVPAAEPPPAWKLTKDSLGKLPAGWVTDKTGMGEGSVWKVVADDTAPSKSGFALAQTAASPNLMFNLCVQKDGNYKDVELRVAFKAVKGDKDQ